MVIHDLTGGGAEQQLSYLAPELVRKGHQVHLFYCKKGPNDFSLDGVFLYKANDNEGDFSLFRRILKLARIIKPDIIHTWLLKMDILGGLVALCLRIPWVFREPSSKFAYPNNIKNKGRIWMAKFSDAILCNSQNGYDFWLNKVKTCKIHIVPNGLPLELIKSSSAYELISFYERGPILLYAGRLVEGKNIDLLIKALSISNKRMTINCIICGEGDLKIKLMELVKNHNLEEKIRFIGHLPQISLWELMKKVTAYVSLSGYEGCPNTTLEAMACGAPIFLSNIPAHLEIADNNSAFIVDVTDINNISSTFENYLIDFEKLKQKSEIALNRVSRFSIEKMVNHHLSVYQNVI